MGKFVGISIDLCVFVRCKINHGKLSGALVQIQKTNKYQIWLFQNLEMNSTSKRSFDTTRISRLKCSDATNQSIAFRKV